MVGYDSPLEFYPKMLSVQLKMYYTLQEEPFKIIKEKYPERLKKIVLIPGDSTIEDLALSTMDKQRLLKEVSVVFNAAANVKFDLTLKQAVNINTVGALNVLNIAKQVNLFFQTTPDYLTK